MNTLELQYLQYTAAYAQDMMSKGGEYAHLSA